MRCDQCAAEVAAEEAVQQGSRTLCEDCLMDALSPAKACDPWAVKLAKGADLEARSALKGTEKALYELVLARGRVPREEAPQALGVTPRELQRAFAVLRHMELLRGDRRPDGGADLVPFAQG